MLLYSLIPTIVRMVSMPRCAIDSFVESRWQELFFLRMVLLV
jgi:hypothetical protein